MTQENKYQSKYKSGAIIKRLDDTSKFVLEGPEEYNGKFFLAKAKDCGSGKTCFLKFTAANNNDKSIINNIGREVAFRFSHPYIAKVYETFEGKTPDDIKIYGVALEYVDGIDLEEYRKNEKNIEENIKVYFSQILQFLHAMKYYTCFGSDSYLHRDLKPQNLMIKKDGTVKLVDFDCSHEAQSTKTRYIKNYYPPFSTGYTSPEVFKINCENLQTEIYSAGRTIFFWLNGKNYYTKEQCMTTNEHPASTVYCRSEELQYGFEKNKDRFIEIFRREEYSGLMDILEKMCARPNSQRYGSVDEIIEDMERFLLGYCGNSPKEYEKLFGNLKILQNPAPMSSGSSLMAACRINDGMKQGSPLYEFAMRDIRLDGRLLLTIYNLDDHVYFIPVVGAELTVNGEPVSDDYDYQIHNKDIIAIDGINVEFTVEEKGADNGRN